MSKDDTIIYCPQAQRDLWVSQPGHLAQQWMDQYPGLFDEDDLRLTITQPHYHFYEWSAAIHLFHRDGAMSMVEKYAYPAHSIKMARCKELFDDSQMKVMDSIRLDDHVQLPDLLVVSGDGESFSFAEMKGPGDELSERQLASHKRIREELGTTVENITVRVI